MKRTRASAIISAMAITLVTVVSPLNACAEISAVYEDFNKNDVNGTVTVKIPKDTTAEVNITFTSPEVTDEPYYTASLTGGSSQSFDIEGRDTTQDDYRNYTLSVSVTGSQYENTITYTDTFTVPDGNDNPNSFMKCEYNFTVDDKDTGNEWDISSETESQKNITLHFGSYVKGDVNNDGFIDAVDATSVLIEYAVLSTGGESTFTQRQKLSANVNNDEFIDAVDATQILAYYAELSTGGNPSWDNTDTSGTTTAKTTTTTTTAVSSDSTATTTTTTSSKPSAVDYSSYVNAVNLLESKNNDSILFHNYYVYDINNDEIYELITEMGTCEADNKYSVYSMKGNEMIFAGDIGAGHSTLVEKDGKLYRDNAHMSQQIIDLIAFDGKKITTETVYENSSSTEYTKYGTAINSYDWSDTSGIKNISQSTSTVTTAPQKTTSKTTTTTATTKATTTKATTTATSTTTTATTLATTTNSTIPQKELDLAMKKAIDSDLRDPRYCYEDVNNDNIPELFIQREYMYGMGGRFIDVFVYRDGKFVSTNKWGSEIYVCHEKNLLRVQANEGADVNLFYVVAEDGNLELVDSLSIYVLEYYHNDSKISKSEYDTKMAEYDAMSWSELEYKQVPLYEDCPNIQNAPSDMIYYSTAIKGTVDVDSGGLNLRTGAGTNYNIILSIAKNTEIQILGDSNDWYYIRYSSGTATNYGYVSKDYVSLAS